MEVELREYSRTVRVGQRRYLPPKCEFLDQVTRKLVDFGFLKTFVGAEWIAALLVVPKAPANLRLTVDICPVNAATK